MKLYYSIDKEIYKENSSNNKLFESRHVVYFDKDLKKKAGEICFLFNNIKNSNDKKNIIQGNIVDLILLDGTVIRYTYIRKGYDKIKNKCAFSNNPNIKKVSRKYINDNMRQLKLY